MYLEDSCFLVVPNTVGRSYIVNARQEIHMQFVNQSTTACLTMALGIANLPEPPSADDGEPVA